MKIKSLARLFLYGVSLRFTFLSEENSDEDADEGSRPHLLPGQSLPQRLVLPAKPLVLLLRLPQLGLQVLQVLLLLLPGLTGRLAVLYHPLLPLQHLHLQQEEEDRK